MKAPQALTEAQLDYIAAESDPYLKKVDAIPSLKAAGRVRVDFAISAALEAAGGSVFVVSPIKGDVVRLVAVSQASPDADHAVTVEIGGEAITGLSVTLLNSGAAGDVYADDVDPASGTGGTDVEQDGAVEIVVAAGGTAVGGAVGFIEIQPRK